MRPLGEGDPTAIIFPTLIVLVVGIGLFMLATFVFRKKVKQVEDVPPAGFTLSDLRQMHKSGQMSTEEYERARAKLVAVTKHAAAAPAATPNPGRRGDTQGTI
jgi:hypothetical protein